MMTLNVIKILLPSALAFLIGIAITPTISRILYKNKLWKKNIRSQGETITNKDFKRIHNSSEEISTPRMGGIIIWMSVLLSIGLIWGISKFFPSELASKLDFFSKNQTLIPLASLLLGSFLGIIDDFLEVLGVNNQKGKYDRDILFRYFKILMIILAGIVLASWFYFKLDVNSISIPFTNLSLELGYLFIPFFILVLVAVFSGGVIDGLDGLSGGVLAIIFSSYAIIAYGQNQIDIAAFSGVISGSILAFLWFNIPPARFYMGETGMMGLLIVLTVIAFLTDTVLILPLIALPLFVSSASSIIQIVSYKYFGKKRVFKIAPLHHHFRAVGWSREKVVMRYWIVSILCAMLSIIIVFIS